MMEGSHGKLELILSDERNPSRLSQRQKNFNQCKLVNLSNFGKVKNDVRSSRSSHD